MARNRCKCTNGAIRATIGLLVLALAASLFVAIALNCEYIEAVKVDISSIQVQLL